MQNHEFENLVLCKFLHELQLPFSKPKWFANAHFIMNASTIKNSNELLTDFIQNNMIIFYTDDVTYTRLTK